MKNASLLLAFCVLFGFSALAQSTTTIEKNTNRITITTKKVDENGKVFTETWIAEGDEPSQILKEMAVHPEVIQKIEVENEVEIENGTDENTIFFFRSAGDNTTIEGKLDENVKADEDQQVIVIRSFDGDAPGPVVWECNKSRTKAYSYIHAGGKKANCAAMGVYIGGYDESGGARVSGLIENGGAAEAGLQEGDIIVKVDEYVVDDFNTLYDALSHFRPGDKVSIRYMREGETIKTKVLLKDWAELPGHEFRSRDDCGKPELPIDISENGTNPDDPSSLPNVQTLQLEDVRIYPNPSDGKFALSFTSEPGPLTVSVADASGKVVFRDENDNTSGSYQREINITDLPQGYYVIYVKQDDKYFTQQISKQ